MKAYRFFSWILCVLLSVLYLAFGFAVSCMFDFFPWYDSEGFYLLLLLFAWLPLSVITIIQIVISLICKQFHKPSVILLCLNALYIPLIFILGYAEISLNVFRTIGVIGVVTMITYVVLFIKKIKKI